MIRIAGLGVSGAYLYRRLSDAGFKVTAFDPKREGFYLPCGYALNENVARTYLKLINLEVEDYVESRAHNIIFQSGNREIEFKSLGLCTVDKNRLLSDLLGNLPFERRKAPAERDVVTVDATGISRSILGPIGNDFIMHTKEYLTSTASHHEFYFRYFSKGHGYYWEFPLGDHFHVGAGSDVLQLINSSLNVKGSLKVASRNIRLKPALQDIFRENVVGVGESIGTVSPITGEGIMPAMESAELLFQNLTKYENFSELSSNYSADIIKTFRRYEVLYSLLENARKGKILKLSNLIRYPAVREDFRHFGINLTLYSVAKTLIGK